MNKAIFTKIESTIASNLETANSNIKIAVAWFTNPFLLTLLLKKQKSGVRVKLILANDVANFNKKYINFLSQFSTMIYCLMRSSSTQKIKNNNNITRKNIR